MRKLKFASVLVAGLLSSVAANADNVLLDFNGVTGFNSVNEFYNGGTDSNHVAGTNYGVSFSPSIVALTNDAAGTYLSNSPSATAFFAAQGDPMAYMNVAGGFTGALGLSWASTGGPTTVKIYSGLNGQGDLLSSFVLDANSDACADGVACVWGSINKSFAGVAESVDFVSNSPNTLFTNISLSTTPVPLPAAGLLLLSGLGVFGVRRRKV